MKLAAAFSAILCLAAPLRSASGTGVLGGRVIDAATHEPIAGAQVSMFQTRGDGHAGQQLKTDAGGQFLFSGLGVGSFNITASAGRGYLEGAPGKRRPRGDGVWIALAANERRDDLTIEMFRAASVSGRVLGEQGLPLTIAADAWPRSVTRALGYHVEPSRVGQVDADGTFQISDLTPGDYVIVATVWHDTAREAPPQSGCAPPPPAGFRVPPPERPIGTLYSRLPRGISRPKPLADGTQTTYRTTFFPGVEDFRDAATISLGSGEQRQGVEFQLTSAVATRVRGQLTTDKRLDGGEVRLRLPDDPRRNGGEARTWLQPGSGDFTLLDVPPGAYVLEPTRYSGVAGCDVIPLDAESSLTHVAIDVPAGGITGLVVPFVKGTQVRGSVVLHGASRPPLHVDVDLPSLDRLGEWPGAIGITNGVQLRVEGVTPGAYELHAIDNAVTPVWWLDGVTVAGRDVTGLPLSVGRDGLSDVVVTMTDRPSKVTGAVRTTTNQPVADATVVLFPADHALWPNARVGAVRFQTSRALRGLYEFADVPAGTYFLAAVDETTMDAWPSADFLGRLATAATRVTVAHETPQTIALTMKR